MLNVRDSTHDGDCILADIFKPDKAERTGPKAVNAFHLILSNDDVLKRCSRFQKKHRIGITCFLGRQLVVRNASQAFGAEG